MNSKNNFDVIVIGSNHINTLGVIRSLGEKGVFPYLLLIGNKYSYTLKSKYIKKYWIVEEEKESIFKLLCSIKNNFTKRTYIIPTSDFAAYIIDENYDLLSKYFVLPNINETQGEIIKYMDKNSQFKLANKKINMASTIEFDLEKDDIYQVHSSLIPCILKPIISAGNQKSDIQICKDFNDLKDYVVDLKNKGYKKILLQQYIDYDYECDISGISNGKVVEISNIIKKINIYPSKRGSTSCGKIIANNTIDLTALKELMSSIKYNGIFDVEIFVKGDQYYLNEINFRNSAISYSLTKENNYIPYSWIQINEGYDTNISNHKKDYVFIVEDFEIKSLLKREIKFSQFLSHLFKSSKKIYFSIKDIKPFIFKLIYMIRKDV